MRSKLENLPDGHYITKHYQYKCDAYTPIGSLVVVRTKDEMIDFIDKSKNFFGCPEDYEYYFGFERKWNESTGEIIETVREYYNRGGEFTKIPDKYPSAIYFPYGDVSNDSYESTKFQWIYIGDVK